MSRVVVVRGPHQGVVIEHDDTRGSFFRAHSRQGILGRALSAIGARERPRSVLYRIFSRALPTDERGDAYAAAWCEQHDTFADRCPCAPESPIRRWVRFGPRFDRTQLDPGAPGSRESKWHLLLNWRQVEQPWVAACKLIVYGPVVEEFRHATLTPVDAPMCRNCKRVTGLVERVPRGIA